MPVAVDSGHENSNYYSRSPRVSQMQHIGYCLWSHSSDSTPGSLTQYETPLVGVGVIKLAPYSPEAMWTVIYE